MATNHDGIKQATEQEAVLLFELPEVQQVADQVAASFRDADLISGQAEDLRRQGAVKALEVDAQWRLAAAATQAEGGRLLHVEANRLATEATTLMLDAASRSNDSERKNLEGEKAWAELAAKHAAYVPHGRRLEVKAAEKAGWVYCCDFEEGEMGMHEENTCPNGSLRHTSYVKMLRRKGKGGKLDLWPGRKV